MTCAYSELYIENARTVLGMALHTGVNVLGFGLKEFYDLFLVSEYAKRFAGGDFRVLAGMSGTELAYRTVEECGLEVERVESKPMFERSQEYWTGWALAYYQWRTSLSFSQINSRISIDRVHRMYNPYHEMDIMHFMDKMNELYAMADSRTNLKLLREMAGKSQSQLARESGVPVRTIQQYEQRQKDINKARGEYLVKLARVLGRSPNELLELIES